jgi:hypothetical protein
VPPDGRNPEGDFQKYVEAIKKAVNNAPHGAHLEAMLQLAREEDRRLFWDTVCADNPNINDESAIRAEAQGFTDFVLRHSPTINVKGTASSEAEDLCANDPDLDKAPGSPCKRALNLVYGDRQRDYGHPADNWGRIARYWSAYLFNRFGISVLVEPRDVGWMNILQKIARDNETELGENIDDTAGYAEGMHLVTERDASQTSETYPAEAQEKQTCST